LKGSVSCASSVSSAASCRPSSSATGAEKPRSSDGTGSLSTSSKLQLLLGLGQHQQR
jgi:hypothetical protein